MVCELKPPLFRDGALVCTTLHVYSQTCIFGMCNHVVHVNELQNLLRSIHIHCMYHIMLVNGCFCIIARTHIIFGAGIGTRKHFIFLFGTVSSHLAIIFPPLCSFRLLKTFKFPTNENKITNQLAKMPINWQFKRTYCTFSYKTNHTSQILLM